MDKTSATTTPSPPHEHSLDSHHDLATTSSLSADHKHASKVQKRHKKHSHSKPKHTVADLEVSSAHVVKSGESVLDKTQAEKYKEISERLLLYITVICSFAIVEGMIGFSHTNVHIVRDFLQCLLMLSALVFSSKALQLSQMPKNEDFQFGYRRFNLLAAFVNSVYLLFSFVFAFVDNLHHMVEHWEVDEASRKSLEIKGLHDEITHIKEMNQYLTLFSFLRMVILGAYLYFESRNQDIADYMQVNWLGWHTENRSVLKEKARQCAKWDSFRLNIYSISLLMGCEFVISISNIWIYYVCIHFGILENLFSMFKGILISALAVPLCLDICYTLLQKVNPAQLVQLVEDKVKKVGYIDGVVAVG